MSRRAWLAAVVYVLAPLALAAGAYWWMSGRTVQSAPDAVLAEDREERALRLHRADVAFAESAARANPDSAPAFLAVADASTGLADFLGGRGDDASRREAIAAMLRSVEASGEALRLEPRSTVSKLVHSTALGRAAILLEQRGSDPERGQAVDLLRKAVRFAESALTPLAEDEAVLNAACVALSRLGSVLMQRRGEGDLGEAQDAFQRGVQFAERAVAAKPQSPEAVSNLAQVLCSLGDYFAQRGLTGDLNFPPEYYQRAADSCETWLAKNADTGTVREALATALGKAGDFLVKRGAVGDAEDALALYERALEVQKKTLELRPDSRSNVLSVARTHRRLAEVAETLGRADQANANWRDCRRRLGEFVKAGGTPDGDAAALSKRLDERFNQSAKTGK